MHVAMTCSLCWSVNLLQISIKYHRKKWNDPKNVKNIHKKSITFWIQLIVDLLCYLLPQVKITFLPLLFAIWSTPRDKISVVEINRMIVAVEARNPPCSCSVWRCQRPSTDRWLYVLHEDDVPHDILYDVKNHS